VPLSYVNHVLQETSLIRAALVSADPSAPVPSCQGWNADNLLGLCVPRTLSPSPSSTFPASDLDITAPTTCSTSTPTARTDQCIQRRRAGTRAR
jgi:hypothetical protein